MPIASTNEHTMLEDPQVGRLVTGLLLRCSKKVIQFDYKGNTFLIGAAVYPCVCNMCTSV